MPIRGGISASATNAAALILAGDVTGTGAATVVSAIRGTPTSPVQPLQGFWYDGQNAAWGGAP